MPSTKLERDMPIIQQHWINFMTIIKQELNNLNLDLRNITIECKKMERLAKILQHNEGDISFLLLHKESILSLDNGLEKKFAILTAFQKRNNLDNAVALRTYHEIVNSEKVKHCADSLEELRAKQNSLQNMMAKMSNLLLGEAYDKAVIDNLCVKYNLQGAARTAITLYPIIKTLKKKEKTNEEVLDDNIKNEAKALEAQNPLDSPNYKMKYAQIKERYQQLGQNIEPLLAKYREIIARMSPAESQYYKIYCSLTAPNGNNLVNGTELYEETAAKITALKLITVQKEITDLMMAIEQSSKIYPEKAELLESQVQYFANLGQELSHFEQIIVKNNSQKITDSQVYFLVDRNMNSFLPAFVTTGEYRDSFLKILNPESEDNTLKPEIKALRIKDKKFNQECNRPVYMVRNEEIIVSYLKLNSAADNPERILVLTATRLFPNTILEETNNIIREYRDHIIRLVTGIERLNPEFIGLQEVIRQELLLANHSLQEGDEVGRKI